MDEIERLAANAEIRNAKARYFRGVDCDDGELVKSILAKDCVLDYNGCCTDPVSGTDHMPAMNVVLNGRDSWQSGAFQRMGIVTVHQHHQADIEITGEDSARATFAMTDRFFFPPGGKWARFEGFGFYHETYVREDGAWKIATLRIERLKVDTYST